MFKVMKLKGLFFVTLFSFGLFISAIQPTVNPAKERLILNAIVNYLDALHLNPVDLDDAFSEMAFDNYLQMIDPGKRFLIHSEVDQLSAYRFEIDEQVNRRSFDLFNLSEEIINNSRARAKDIFYEVIESDLSEVETYQLEMDVDKRTFPNDEEELKLLWKKIIKYDFNNRLKSKLENQNKKLEEAEKEDAEEDEEYKPKTREELEEEVIEAIKKSYENWFENIDKDRRTDKFQNYINAITHVFDPHSDYLNPKSKEDFDIQMGGKLEGIGARLSTQDDMTKVVSIVPGGPAWKGNELEVDDLISAVKQEDAEPVNIVGMRLDDVVQMIRGKKGTEVTLTVKKVDGTIKDIVIERDEVIIDESFARSLILDMPGTVDNIGYIKLPKFYSSFEKEDGNSCAKDVKIEIEKLNAENVNGIILDLRNNGGGSLRDVIDMSGLFIKEGPIVQVKPRSKEAYVYNDEDPEVHFTEPLVVMVNQFSASASEILAAALQDYNRAVIVGSKSTFGKGTVQRFVDLDRAYREYNELKPMGNLKITMQKFYRINGGSTQLKGVIPDVILPDNFHYLETGERDYENAMDWTEITPLEYEQDVYTVDKLDMIIENSSNRVAGNEDFQLILENAERLKRNQEESIYPLDYEAFSALREKRAEEAKKYDGLFEDDIENLEANNLEIDTDYINMDESRVARNDEWLKDVKKDIYLEEVMYILKDMMSSDTGIVQSSDLK
jgi:carboxyl-terminal processing protease